MWKTRPRCRASPAVQGRWIQWPCSLWSNACGCHTDRGRFPLRANWSDPSALLTLGFAPLQSNWRSAPQRSAEGRRLTGLILVELSSLFVYQAPPKLIHLGVGGWPLSSLLSSFLWALLYLVHYRMVTLTPISRFQVNDEGM